MFSLPPEYEKRMRAMLGAEFPVFLESCQSKRLRGLRVNTLKVSPEEFETLSPFPVKRIPWVDNGFFYSEDVFPAQHPYYAAGLYYLQEPSAMTPASRLPVKDGDRVLDLCAAPGGKATELAAKLHGTGLLVANDISNARAKALLRNLELFGVRNMVVTNESPDRLAGSFPQFFDKILVDAPCSGEGMFRKSPDAAEAWSPEKVMNCARTQGEILAHARAMLRPGGMLLYSTCTFSPEENEQQIAAFLQRFSDMKLIPMKTWSGFSSGRPDWADGNPELEKCIRIWPHKMDGEGHFLALMQKEENASFDVFPTSFPPSPGERPEKAGKRRSRASTRSKANLISENRNTPDREQLSQITPFLGCLSPDFLQNRGNSAYYVQNNLPMLSGLHFLRNGVFLGEWKKNRFEPSQPLALALGKEDPVPRLDFSPDDPRLMSFLRGESVFLKAVEAKIPDGWKLVTADGQAVGWGKLTRGQLKNKIGASWRIS